MPNVALIHPPACDPTAPYLAVPMLAGFLRAHGVDVLPVDANVRHDPSATANVTSTAACEGVFDPGPPHARTNVIAPSASFFIGHLRRARRGA